jgi:hypothetical protein
MKLIAGQNKIKIDMKHIPHGMYMLDICGPQRISVRNLRIK